MKKERNTAEILGGDYELDDIELPEGEAQERTLVLKTSPRSRRIQLMAQGAREIRCLHCNHIKPLSGAEESEEGWFCEDCVSELSRKLIAF